MSRHVDASGDAQRQIGRFFHQLILGLNRESTPLAESPLSDCAESYFTTPSGLSLLVDNPEHDGQPVDGTRVLRIWAGLSNFMPFKDPGNNREDRFLRTDELPDDMVQDLENQARGQWTLKLKPLPVRWVAESVQGPFDEARVGVLQVTGAHYEQRFLVSPDGSWECEYRRKVFVETPRSRQSEVLVPFEPDFEQLMGFLFEEVRGATLDQFGQCRQNCTDDRERTRRTVEYWNMACANDLRHMALGQRSALPQTTLDLG